MDEKAVSNERTQPTVGQSETSRIVEQLWWLRTIYDTLPDGALPRVKVVLTYEVEALLLRMMPRINGQPVIDPVLRRVIGMRYEPRLPTLRDGEEIRLVITPPRVERVESPAPVRPPGHGWTSHGHSCCDRGLSVEPMPAATARCMGPPTCRVCWSEVEALHGS